MTTLTILLSESLWKFVESQVAEGGHSSASDYVLTLIREDQERKARAKVEALLLEGLDSGPATAMTREDWENLERRVWEYHGQGIASLLREGLQSELSEMTPEEWQAIRREGLDRDELTL